MLRKLLGLVEFNLPQGSQIINTVLSAQPNWIPDKIDTDNIAQPVKLRFGTEEAAVKFCTNLLAEIYNISTKQRADKSTGSNRLPGVLFEHPELASLIEKIYESSHRTRKK